MAMPELQTTYALNLSTVMPLSVSDTGVPITRVGMQRRENMNKYATGEWENKSWKRSWFTSKSLVTAIIV